MVTFLHDLTRPSGSSSSRFRTFVQAHLRVYKTMQNAIMLHAKRLEKDQTIDGELDPLSFLLRLADKTDRREDRLSPVQRIPDFHSASAELATSIGPALLSEPVQNLFNRITRKHKTIICNDELIFLSQFFQSLRDFSSHPKHLSTTHRFGSTANV